MAGTSLVSQEQAFVTFLESMDSGAALGYSPYRDLQSWGAGRQLGLLLMIVRTGKPVAPHGAKDVGESVRVIWAVNLKWRNLR
jgi:hypothetical protein